MKITIRKPGSSKELEGFDVLSIGYPTNVLRQKKVRCSCCSRCSKEDFDVVFQKASCMYEFRGKALFPDDRTLHNNPTFQHDCRLSRGCSGGPVLVQKEGKCFVIGLNIRAASIESERMSREAVLFSTEVIKFIREFLTSRGIEPGLKVTSKDSTGSH